MSFRKTMSAGALRSPTFSAPTTPGTRRFRPLHPPRHETAGIDWEAVITGLDAGMLVSSAGERRMLRLAASLATDVPVCLGEGITGIDDRNVDLVAKAIHHASGQRQFLAGP
jgi:hypothetical protein